MTRRLQWLTRYSSQIWLLVLGTLASSLGQSLVWPFLTIYIRMRLDIPLTTITLLFMLQSIAGFAVSALLGPVMDRSGRKMPMLIGLLTSGLTLLMMSQAATLLAWTFLLPLYGIVSTVFRMASYAMVADIIAPERRSEVYALLRMGDNLGITLGPGLGGFLITMGYTLAYTIAAGTQFVLVVFVSLIIRETIFWPASSIDRAGSTGSTPASGQAQATQSVGYGALLRDHRFLAVWGLYILVQIASSLLFVLLGLYVKENFAIPEDQFGLIIGTNAAVVVFFQYSVTQFADRHPPLSMMSLGALLYGTGMLIFALSRAFGGFWVGIVVLTIGENLLVPTGTALVANLAPPDMRARYVGLFSMSFRIGAGVGPILGGFLNDHVAPVATWYSGMLFCYVAAVGFVMLARRWQRTAQDPAVYPAGCEVDVR